ncbi:MAG: DNA polymerase III subunit delta [Candidatus Omnitrophota bacterium]
MNYLLVGPEGYLKHQFLEKLKNSVLGADTNSSPDFGMFTVGVTPLAEILAFLNTMPFISKKRLALVNNIEEISPAEKDSILKYLKSPSESAVLVLWDSSDESWKFSEKIFTSTKIIRCNRLKEGEINSWIRKEFAARGKKISASAATLIIELAGNDLFLLKNEIEKIVSFAGKDGEITERHVEELCGMSAYKTAFELVDMVVEKRIEEALLPMRDLSTREKPHRILNLLAWQFRNFIKIKNLPKGLSPDEISRSSGIKMRFIRKTLQGSRRFTEAELERNLEVLLEADFFIKRGKLLPQHALERALVRLCAA